MSVDWEVAVIGAGPAGLAAATLLAEKQVRVVLLDEQAAPGGQIYRGIEAASAELRNRLGPDYAEGAALVARFRASKAAYLPGSSVWQVTPQCDVWVSREGASFPLRAEAVILATGAMERPVPLPGWTLPGVMTAGAVQILLKSSGMVARGPMVLAGSGPLLLLLAAQCLAAGVRPVAVLDSRSSARRAAALRHLPASTTAWRYLAKGMRLIAALRRSGVPVYPNASDLRIEGEDAVEAISFRADGVVHRIAAGIVALHEGIIPAQQMARSIGCAHRWNVDQRAFCPEIDAWGNSSVENILIAGDGAGIGGAWAAAHGGRLAGLEALRRLGRIDTAERDRLGAADRRGQRAHGKIRRFLDLAYAPPEAVLAPADDVVVCRCEEVTAGALRLVAAAGCPGPNQAKSFLRVGMGPCQGRLCGPTVSAVMAKARGVTLDQIGYFQVRAPLKPVTLGEIAALGDYGAGNSVSVRPVR